MFRKRQQKGAEGGGAAAWGRRGDADVLRDLEGLSMDATSMSMAGVATDLVDVAATYDGDVSLLFASSLVESSRLV